MLLLTGAGFGVTWIPWGNPEGFHGVGEPIPQVIWDDGKDYPNILAPFENVLLFWIVALVLYAVVKLTLWILRRMSLKKTSQASS